MEVAERIRGCLVVGAVGDALGAAVEFDGWDAIVARYGPAGIAEPAPGARFTDDTQMTLFTAEGLIRASVRGRARGICSPPAVVWRAYQRWLWTQGVAWSEVIGTAVEFWPRPTGWLAHDQRLHRREAPGATCLGALRSGRMGTRDEPINQSKGCGGVMRAAPAGFSFDRLSRKDVYDLGADVAAITHGHPGGWEPAGALAVMVAALVEGAGLADALAEGVGVAPPGLTARLGAAVTVGRSGRLGPEVIASELGAGWVGDEALAIAVACAVAFDEPVAALRAAVNHAGDSDSTGSICGQVLGAAHGVAAVPEEWLERVEAIDLVETVAADAALERCEKPGVPAHLVVPEDPDALIEMFPDDDIPAWWLLRYPGG